MATDTDNQAPVVEAQQVAVTKTDSEQFSEELQVLLNKYPNVRLGVSHQIQIKEIGAMANTKLE